MAVPCPPFGMPPPSCPPFGMPQCMPCGMPPPCGMPFPPCNPYMPPSCFMPPPTCYYPYPPPPCYMPSPGPGFPCRPQPPACFPALSPQCQIPPQCGPPCPPKPDICSPCGIGREVMCVPRGCPPMMRNGGSCIPKPNETSFFRKPATYNNCNFYVTPAKKGLLLEVPDQNQNPNNSCGGGGGGEGIDISLNVDTGDGGATCTQQATFEPGHNAPAGDDRICPAPVGYPGSPRQEWGGGQTSGDRSNRRPTYESSPREKKHSQSPHRTTYERSPERPSYQQRSPPINVRRPVHATGAKKISLKPNLRGRRAATKSNGSSRKSRPPWHVTGSNCAASGPCSTHWKKRSTSSKSKSPFRSKSKQHMMSNGGRNARTNFPQVNNVGGTVSRIHANIQMRNEPGRTQSRIHIRAETSHSNVNATNPRMCSTSPNRSLRRSPARQSRKPFKNTCFPKCPPPRHKKKSCSPKPKVCYTGPPQPPACPVPAPARCEPQLGAVSRGACALPKQPAYLPFSRPVNHACPPPRMVKHKRKQVCYLPKQAKLKALCGQCPERHAANNCHAGLPMPQAPPARQRPARHCPPPVPHFQHQSQNNAACQKSPQIRVCAKISQTRAGRPGHGPGPLVRSMSGDYSNSRQDDDVPSGTGVDQLYKNSQPPVSSRTVNVRPSSSMLGRSAVSTVCVSISAPTLSTRVSSRPKPPGVRKKDKVRKCRSVSHNTRKQKQPLKTIDEERSKSRAKNKSSKNKARPEKSTIDVDKNQGASGNVSKNEDIESYAETDTEDEALKPEKDGDDPALKTNPINNEVEDEDPADSALSTTVNPRSVASKEEPSGSTENPSSIFSNDDDVKPDPRNRNPAQQTTTKRQAPKKQGQDPNRPKKTEPEVDSHRRGSDISLAGSEDFLWTAADSGFRNPPAVLDLDDDENDRSLVIKDGYARYQSTKGAKVKPDKNVIPPPPGFAQQASTEKSPSQVKVENRK